MCQIAVIELLTAMYTKSHNRDYPYMGEQEAHLLQRLSQANVTRVACSVYLGNQQFCETAFRALRDRLGEIDVVFFDSASVEWAVGA